MCYIVSSCCFSEFNILFALLFSITRVALSGKLLAKNDQFVVFISISSNRMSPRHSSYLFLTFDVAVFLEELPKPSQISTPTQPKPKRLPPDGAENLKIIDER